MDATTIGRDNNQNTYNTYQAMAPDGMSMSYVTFKRAVDAELGNERRRSYDQTHALEQKYQKLLADAFADYQDVTGERDRLRSDNAFLSGRGVALRASWKFPVGVAVVALLCGAFLANALRSGQSGTVSATAKTTAVGPSSKFTTSPTSTPTSPSTPAYVPMGCGQGTFVVQLEAVNPADGFPDVRALVLQQELADRIKHAHLVAPVLASQGKDYCVAKRPEVANDVYLWSGPFSTRQEADATCQRFHAEAVSEDCYPVSIQAAR